ncbi:MAG: heterocyst development glycosyltransferase HepC [Thainema sp.]
MVASKVVLRTSRVLLLDATDSTDSFEGPSYQLKWRFDKLWVRAMPQQQGNYLPALSNSQWLKECLEHSSIEAVCLDPNLGEDAIKCWADACEQADKSVFLRLPPAQALPKRQKPIIWQIKRTFDWLTAVAILMGFSPILLALALLIWWLSPNTIFTKEWAIGHRGRLFRLYKFNVANVNSRQSPLCSWIKKCGLDKLPQLIHVVCGNISLVGPRPYMLVEIDQGETKQILSCLRALPGITGARQMSTKLFLHNSSHLEQPELQYLSSWSLKRDIQFLLLAIPKVILGISTY